MDTGASNETLRITAVGPNSIAGIFRVAHAGGVPVRLFAQPYLTGVIPPAGLGAGSSASVTKLEFFGNMNGDGTLYYVEYNYDNTNAQITRSMTPITQANMNPALPLVRNVKSNSVQFTLYTDALGVVTSASVALTVQNTWSTAVKFQETALSSRIVVPSAVAGSALLSEIRTYGGANKLPPTPAQVAAWSSQ